MFIRFTTLVLTLLIPVCLWAKTDSLIVSASGLQSPTGIWWPEPAKKKAGKKNVPMDKIRAEAPVVVWFHGGMTSGNCSKGLVAGDDFAKLFPDRIVVSASACRQNHWAAPQTLSVVDAALDSVAARRKAPVTRVDLVGISDGALGVILYSYSGKREIRNRLLMSSYGASLGEASQIAAQPKLKTGRWRFLQGGSDRLYPQDQTVPWIESFCKNVGVDCDLKFDPAGEHDWQYWKLNRLPWIRDAILGATP
ncbi:MAG: hypothetical protein MJY82_01295 [Fibrobacter sp.]|nr:hypothetical protein [Fibrobacter sp.]